MISIIIPTYNGEKTIIKTLESILDNNSSNFEVIVVNDGSNDNTINLLKNYIKDKDNVKIIEKENSGVSESRNAGIINARGNYIMFCDDDDLYQASLIDNIEKDIKKYNPQYISFGRIDINNNHEYRCSDYNDIKIYNDINKYLIERFCKGYTTFSVCNKVYNKELLDKYQIRFNKSLDLSEDLDFNLKYFEYIDGEVLEDDTINYLRICYQDSTIYRKINNYFEKSIAILENIEKESKIDNKKNIFDLLKCHFCTISLNRLFSGQDASDINFKEFNEKCKIIYTYLRKNNIQFVYRKNTRNNILFSLFKCRMFFSLYIVSIKIGNLIRKRRNS